MDIKKMTKERLISDHESRFIGGGKCWVTRDELLRRLGEGEKAIKTLPYYVSISVIIISLIIIYFSLKYLWGVLQ